jgi:hypothetical protein
MTSVNFLKNLIIFSMTFSILTSIFLVYHLSNDKLHYNIRKCLENKVGSCDKV